MYVLAFLLALQVGNEELARPTLRIDVHQLAPCVIISESNGTVKGIEIDLLRQIAREEGYEPIFRPIAEFKNIFDGLRSGEADLAIAGITASESREREFDFSHPTSRGDLVVLVRKTSSTWWEIALIWAQHAIPIGLILLLIPLAALTSFLLERRTDPETTYRREWWESAFFCLTLNFISNPPKTNRGRLVLLVAGGITVLLISLQTAIFANVSLTDHSKPELASLSELAGKPLATVEGTTSVEIAKNLDARLVTVGFASDALKLLRDKQVLAVLFDKTELDYLMSPSDPFVTMAIVREEDYGFVFPRSSELRERFNRAILRLKESGDLEEIRRKYVKD